MRYSGIRVLLAACLTISFITNVKVNADTQNDSHIMPSEFVSKYYTDVNSYAGTAPVIESLDIKSFTYPGNKIGIRDSIAVDTIASGGSGQGYLYNYSILKDAVLIADLQNNVNSYFEFRPAVSGKYEIAVTVKDISSDTAISESRSVYFNVTGALYEDINLDGIVDIYDLTSLSKNIDCDKSDSPEWYGRWNQNDVDDVIDVRDLARVAEAYNKTVNITSGSSGSTDYSRSALVSYSMTFLGIPYVWGGTGPSGFDTSGFVIYVYNRFGISLPRTTYDQAKLGVPIKKEDLQPGDLIYFGTGTPSHVGIYVGNDCFIHAPQTGDVVKISPLSRTDIIVIRRHA